MTLSRRAIKPLTLVAPLWILAGCTYPGDTSGFKAEKKQSKEEIQRQIESVKSNPNLPENARGMALKKLEQDLANAR